MQRFTTFYIVRHGETTWNVEGLLQGHGDSPLTPEGELQALGLSKKFADVHFDHVFSSDLMRAKRTAELISIEKKLAVNTTHLLRERSFGKYEGRPREQFLTENKELIEQFEKLSEQEQLKFKYADDMESNEEAVTRFLRFLREAAVTYEGKTLLLVSHGGMMRVLLRHLGIKVITGKGTIANGAHIKLESDGIEFKIREMHGIKRE